MNLLLEFLLVVKHNLITIMGMILASALAFRYIAYKAGKRDVFYFKTFARGIEKHLELEDKHLKIQDVDTWVTNLLNKVTDELPHRSMRFSHLNMQGKGKGFRTHKENFAEFAEGRKSIAHGIRQQLDAFRSPFPPNYSELTQRILDQDRQWKNILRVVPVDMVSRMLDILPGLFVVGGIFGTFVGIMNGLPKIASIDLTQMTQAAPILNSFVKDIAFSMNASIVGILCNIIMTILNGLFPVGETRNEIRSTIEKALEFMWYRIHGNEMSTADARIIALLEELVHNAGGQRAPKTTLRSVA